MLNIIRTIVLAFAAFSLSHSALAKPSAKEFGHLPSIADAAISPDGNEVALFINVKGKYAIRVIPVDGKDKGKPRIVMLDEGSKPKFIVWANNDRVLASVWNSEKIRGVPLSTTSLYTIDADSMDAEILVRPRRNFRQYNDVIIDMLEDDPDHILMQFSDNDQSEPDVKKVNIVTKKYETLRRGRHTVQRWITDQRGEPRVGVGLRDSNRGEYLPYMMIRNVNDDEWLDHEDYPGLEAEMDVVGFMANPNHMIVRSNQGRNTTGIYIYDLQAKAITDKLFHNDNYDAGGLIFSNDGTRVLGAKFDAETTQVELYEEYDSAFQRMRKRFNGFEVDYIDYDDSGNKILFEVSNGYTPPTIMLYDGKTEQLFDYGSTYPGLANSTLGLVVPVKYTARDGQKVPAYITLPAAMDSGEQLKNIPFIILPHGGPYARKAGNFDYFAQFFSSRGYGVLQMNFRGSAGYGEAFEAAGRENWEVMLDDVEDGTQWLIEKGYAAPDRICVAGWSFGGYAALMSAIRTPELYQCTISMAGVTDLRALVNDMKNYRFGNVAASRSVLSGFESWKDLNNNSPAKRADEISVPVFLAHGEYDQAVNFDQYRTMKEQLSLVSIPKTFVEFSEEDHYLSQQKHRVKFFTELDVFLTAHLGESEWALD